MSAENVVNTPIVEVAADAVKQKKPTLAGKYSKLLNFGYWFASIIDNEEMKAQMHTQLRLFGTIEEQTELFERFFAEEKDTAKAIRKCIADHNKPPKPVKTKAAKATRKGKAEVHQDELISQLLADANAVVDEPVPAKVDKEAAKLAKEQAKEAAKLAKEQEKADAIRAKEAEKEAAKLAKEQEKADKEMAKLAKKVELEAKAAAKLAKEQEKASKPEKKKATKTSAIAPVAEVVAEPVVLEPVAEQPIVEIVEEVPENTAHVTQELVAEVIE
jgi:fused signal recognition particle receptor